MYFKLIHFYLMLLFCTVSSAVLAQDATSCFSVADGDFNNVNTWNCDGVVGAEYPGKSTNVTITNVVDLNVHFTAGGGLEGAVSGNWDISGTLQNGGNVTFASGTHVISGVFDVGNVVISNGVSIDFQAGSTVSVGDFTNNNNSTGVVVNTSMTVSGDLDNGNGASITTTGGGSIAVTGTITNTGTGSLFGCTADECCGAGGCTLEIELLSIGAKYNNSDVIINWITASEIDNDYFIVEKSTNGNDFRPIGEIQGAGSSFVSLEYSFKEVNAYTDKSSYYRIVDVDYEGLRTVSDVFVLPMQTKESNVIVYSDLEGNIVVSGHFELGSIAYLYDVFGKLITSTLMTSEKNILNKGDVFPGLYVVCIRNPDGTTVFNSKIIL